MRQGCIFTQTHVQLPPCHFNPASDQNNLTHRAPLTGFKRERAAVSQWIDRGQLQMVFSYQGEERIRVITDYLPTMKVTIAGK